MTHTELIQRAIDSNAFKSSDTAAGYVQPTYWDKQLFDHVRANFVALSLGMDVTSRFTEVGGDTYNHSLLAEPVASSAVAETAATTVVAFSPTQVQLSPSERSIAYQVTDKQLRRGFFNTMDEMTKAIGYGIMRDADSLAMSQLANSAGNSVVANGVDSSALASSDTLDYNDIVNAMVLNGSDKYVQHRALLVTPEQAGALAKDSAFKTADTFGSDKSANRHGFIGDVLGMPVYVTTQIVTASNAEKAILLSSPDAFLYILKTPIGGAIRKEYDALGRFNTIVGTLDFDVKVARTNAICSIETYAA